MALVPGDEAQWSGKKSQADHSTAVEIMHTVRRMTRNVDGTSLRRVIKNHPSLPLSIYSDSVIKLVNALTVRTASLHSLPLCLLALNQFVSFIILIGMHYLHLFIQYVPIQTQTNSFSLLSFQEY